jgi:hypothetical protein
MRQTRCEGKEHGSLTGLECQDIVDLCGEARGAIRERVDEQREVEANLMRARHMRRREVERVVHWEGDKRGGEGKVTREGGESRLS